MKTLKILVMMNNQMLITQIEEVSSDLGEPDCKLIEPFIINQSTGSLEPYLLDFTSDNEFMIHSDKIFTIVEPNSKLKKKYEELLK